MQHVISVTVENQPGVLARVASMFARRGFNIHSLTVGPTEDSTLSRMTMVIDGPEMEQIVKQLYKLIHTVKVTELEPGESIESEIMLVRISADPAQRGGLLQVASTFGARAVDVGAASITFEVAGEPSRLADFLELMRTYGIIGLVKSGRVALAKDQKTAGRKLRSA